MNVLAEDFTVGRWQCLGRQSWDFCALVKKVYLNGRVVCGSEKLFRMTLTSLELQIEFFYTQHQATANFF